VVAPVPAAAVTSGGEENKRPIQYELRIEVAGAKGATKGLWASLLYIQRLAQATLDELKGLEESAARKKASPNRRASRVSDEGEGEGGEDGGGPRRLRGDTSLCCPGCLRKMLPNVTQHPIKMLMKQEVVCAQTGEVLALHDADLEETRVIGRASSSSHLVEPVPKRPSWKFCAGRIRLGRPLEDQIGLFKLLGLASQEDSDALKEKGEEAIAFEVLEHYNSFASLEEMKANRDNYGWSDYDWLRYFQDKPPEDEPAKLKAYDKLMIVAKENKFDYERTGGRADVFKESSLDYFAADKMAERAGLNRAHILSLRLYSSSVARTINSKLHDGCSLDRPHPYPATVLILVDALQKLCAAQLTQRTAAAQKAKQLTEAARKAKDDPDADDTDKANAIRRAAEATAANEALQCSVYWRGISGLTADSFTDRGGIEVSFMSMSKERAVATTDALGAYSYESERKASLQAAAEAEAEEEDEASADKDAELEESKAKNQKSDPPPLLFRVVPTEPTMPADLSFVALWPKTAECVYPPGVVLEKKSEWKDLLTTPDHDGERVECTTVELVPRLRTRARRQKL